MITQLENCSVGAPITRQGVSLFPVYVHQRSISVMGGGAESVRVTERERADVPSLLVDNPNQSHVLIAEGETLSGGRQNRLMNVSVLVPAQTQIEVPVSCVEAGRWNGGTVFGRAHSVAPRRVRRGTAVSVTRNLRSHNSRHSDQSLVWEMVDYELRAGGVQSETRALSELSAREQREDALSQSIEELINRGPLPGQSGIVVSFGSRVVATDVFATSELLRENWASLIRGYLLEARGTVRGTPSATKALGFLKEASKRVVSVAPGVGLGDEYRIESSKIAGQALILDDVLVHASAFALAA